MSSSVADDSSQVQVIARALNTAKVLGRVRRGRLAHSEPPGNRQILERTLQQNLQKRLSQISFTDSEQGQSPRFWANSVPEKSPRTSSPFTPTNPLAPGSPYTPSSSFDSVFFSDNSELPLPINPVDKPQVLQLPNYKEDRSSTPQPSQPIVASSLIMSEMEELEKTLKKTCRKITATI